MAAKGAPEEASALRLTPSDIETAKTTSVSSPRRIASRKGTRVASEVVINNYAAPSASRRRRGNVRNISDTLSTVKDEKVVPVSSEVDIDILTTVKDKLTGGSIQESCSTGLRKVLKKHFGSKGAGMSAGGMSARGLSAGSAFGDKVGKYADTVSKMSKYI